jgi:hypothetical protein
MRSVISLPLPVVIANTTSLGTTWVFRCKFLKIGVELWHNKATLNNKSEALNTVVQTGRSSHFREESTYAIRLFNHSAIIIHRDSRSRSHFKYQ